MDEIIRENATHVVVARGKDSHKKIARGVCPLFIHNDSLIANEIRFYENIPRSDHIPIYRGKGYENDRLFCVTESCHERGGTLPKEAIEFVHENGFVHGDVRVQNVLTTDDGRTVLANFEFSRQTADFCPEKRRSLEADDWVHFVLMIYANDKPFAERAKLRQALKKLSTIQDRETETKLSRILDRTASDSVLEIFEKFRKKYEKEDENGARAKSEKQSLKVS